MVSPTQSLVSILGDRASLSSKPSAKARNRPNSKRSGSRSFERAAKTPIGMTATSVSPSLSGMTLISDVPLDSLRRFFEKLEVDPCHGFNGSACVLWTGGKSCGQGKTIKYGVLKYQRQRWYAHRWAARFIHGHDLDMMQVDHLCNRPLCVSHVQAVPPTINRELQWIRVQVGIEDNPCEQFEEDAFPVPFYAEPDWYRQLKALVG